ncbi:MAG: hypothetical protein RI894_682 [Bacteroidota bacterium]
MKMAQIIAATLSPPRAAFFAFFTTAFGSTVVFGATVVLIAAEAACTVPTENVIEAMRKVKNKINFFIRIQMRLS